MVKNTTKWEVFAMFAVSYAIFTGLLVYTPVWVWVVVLLPGFIILIISSREYYLKQTLQLAKTNGGKTNGKTK